MNPHAITALVGLGLIAYGCSGAQPVTKDATCSPKADTEFAASLALKCKGKPLSACPEADAIGDTYEKKAEEECSQR